MADLSEAEILELVASHPLPDGVMDVVMTREELADAMATSVVTITDWLGKGMPCRERGGAGKPYELQLSHCWAWRMARKAEEEVKADQVKRSIAALRLKLVGGTSGNSIEALDPKTRREILAAQMEHERFQRERNQLLQRDDVEETLETLYGIIRDTLNSAPDLIEAREAIPASVVIAMTEVCDEMLESLRRNIEGFWADHPITAAQPVKRTLFDA